MPTSKPPQPAPKWTFLTNHCHVLMCLHEDPESRVRDIAERVGITERAVLRILQELEDSDVITRERAGRRNVYSIHMDQRLRHPVEQHRTVGDLVRLIGPSRTRAGRKSA